LSRGEVKDLNNTKEQILLSQRLMSLWLSYAQNDLSASDPSALKSGPQDDIERRIPRLEERDSE
jgi:hypothetical protein